MNLTQEIIQLNYIVEYIYKREHERAYSENNDIPFPWHVDKRYNEIRQIYLQLLKVKELNNDRLVKEVNKEGN